MYPILKVDSDLYKKLQDREDQIPCKTGPHNRIVPATKCPQCDHYFFARRKNQKYCSGSCRVMACYDRNHYVYETGSYKKPDSKFKATVQEGIGIKDPEQFKRDILSGLSGTKSKISLAGIGESGIAILAAELIKYLLVDRTHTQKLNEIISILKAPKKDFPRLGTQPPMNLNPDDLPTDLFL